MLTENIWFVWSETSYSGDERRCYRCGTMNNERTNIEDRATQPMEAGGWVSQYMSDSAWKSTFLNWRSSKKFIIEWVAYFDISTHPISSFPPSELFVLAPTAPLYITMCPWRSTSLLVLLVLTGSLGSIFSSGSLFSLTSLETVLHSNSHNLAECIQLTSVLYCPVLGDIDNVHSFQYVNFLTAPLLKTRPYTETRHLHVVQPCIIWSGTKMRGY